MIEIFTHHDFTRVGYYESVLKEAGIRCFIQNANSHNLLTGIPSPLFYPKLCIIDDDDFDRALELLKPLNNQNSVVPIDAVEWTCASCGESVPAEFGSCWQCGTMQSTPTQE